MIKGIGTDITDNNRFKDFINDSKKIVRLLSSKEIEKFNLISNDERKIEYMASRFAAKEALFKASNKKFNMNEVSILNAGLQIAHLQRSALYLLLNLHPGRHSQHG